MADYLSFAGGIPLSDTESSNSEEELNVSDLAIEEELPQYQTFEDVPLLTYPLQIAPGSLSDHLVSVDVP